eukprot:COSAG01_NODE_2851_length_6937_cov_13.682228_9_plen_33_part_00
MEAERGLQLEKDELQRDQALTQAEKAARQVTA